MAGLFRSLLLSGLLVAASGAHAAGDLVLSGGPYVPTPQRVVDAMLAVANVSDRDYVIDLGSGDGRIVITAAQKFGARGKGYDIDGELVERSTAAAAKLKLADRVSFEKRDVLQADLSGATVITLYLLPAMMLELRAKLMRELKPGTRIVSHDFDFGDWQPERTVNLELDEKYDITGSWSSTVHLWTVPDRTKK
ncbi:MAG: methyltransferase domain-containing protein [Burkholderiales bacterium]|nr:methyltransferase domain-containing protein [Burkholderiales bacterium]